MSTENTLIQLLRSSRFKTFSKLFIYANKTSYVNLRLYREYLNNVAKGDDDFKPLVEDALVDTAYYTEKSIQTMQAIKDEALKFLPKAKTAALDSVKVQNQVLDAAKAYVRIEKDWERLWELADSFSRSGIDGQEEVAKTDAVNLLRDIVSYADKAISVLKVIQSQLLSAAGRS